MGGKFAAIFGSTKPVIAMVHFGALPGSPLYDAEPAFEGLSRACARTCGALQEAGFDAVMFGNENDRPYEFKVDTASTATMAYVIGQVRDEITVPFGVNVLWDPMAIDGACRRDRRRASCARSSPAPMPPTWGRGRPTPARRCATATGSAASDLALLYNVSAEFAYSLDQRSLADRARSAVFSSHPRCDPGLRRDHRRGGRDVRPRGGEEGAARYAGARQYRRQARDRGAMCSRSPTAASSAPR